MTIKSLYTMLKLILLLSAAFAANSPKDSSSETQAKVAFALLKGLAGEWQSVGAKGQHSRLSYHVVSGGTVVMERFTSDALQKNSGEMVTMYYLEKGELVLTHYCIARNQPHLRATRYIAETGEVDFDFVEGGNISSGNEGHMHSAKLRFIDGDHISSEWQYMEARSPKFTEISQFTRVK